jgi:hypothetical protein
MHILLLEHLADDRGMHDPAGAALIEEFVCALRRQADQQAAGGLGIEEELDERGPLRIAFEPYRCRRIFAVRAQGAGEVLLDGQLLLVTLLAAASSSPWPARAKPVTSVDALAPTALAAFEAAWFRKIMLAQAYWKTSAGQ